jgi:hypothetical protein
MKQQRQEDYIKLVGILLHVFGREGIEPTEVAKDRFHNVVRNALEKEGWIITDDPYEINIDDVDFEIYLAAEQLLGAEREGRKIAVEINTVQLVQSNLWRSP